MLTVIDDRYNDLTYQGNEAVHYKTLPASLRLHVFVKFITA